MEKQIRTGQLLDLANESLKNSLYHIGVGSVVSYDAANQVADIQPMVNDVRTDVDTGARVSEPFQVIPAVPIMWPRFGKFVIAGRLNQYDTVVLLAFDLDPTAWRQSGNSTQPSDPPDVARHAGKYWAAFPCDLRLNPIKGASVANAALYIGLDGGSPVIVINDSTIQLGSSAAGGAVALAQKVDAIMADLKTLATVLAGGAPIVGGSTGIPTPALTAPALALENAIFSVASQLVTIEE